MVSNDKAIFMAVAEKLRLRGFDVDCIEEKSFIEQYSDKTTNFEYRLIFNMVRSNEAISILKHLERDLGVKTINSAFGIDNCVRSVLTKLFIMDNISSPLSKILHVSTSNINTVLSLISIPYPMWLKRGDGSAEKKEDVCFVENELEAKESLKDFVDRGINVVIACQHLEGDLIKFYGVEGTDFFDWGYADGSHSKFGLEEINGKPKGFNFDVKSLKRLSDNAAHTLNIAVYGGDCIVSRNGNVRIIDFNDWPSFSRCRDAASEAISYRIAKEVLCNKTYQTTKTYPYLQ